MKDSHSHSFVSVFTLFIALAAGGAARAQGPIGQDPCPRIAFSIDHQGPTVSDPGSFIGFPITAGDILTPAAGGPGGPNFPGLSPLATPGVFMQGGFSTSPPGLGLAGYLPCVGSPPGNPCPVEVDAITWGRDRPLAPSVEIGQVLFSVDEFAIGRNLASLVPNVVSEGANGAQDASADVFATRCMTFTSNPPSAPPAGHTAVIDGNGGFSLSGARYPGVGIFEPDAPGTPPDSGDNVDALNVGPEFNFGTDFYPAYFSLDSFIQDPLNGAQQTGAAILQGFAGADVLVTPNFGMSPQLFAPANALGLDLFGANTDDLDAIALWENGNDLFEPSVVAFDWLSGARDMLLFSVRRGSRVIGEPDSRFGVPIEPGDVLSTPLPAVLGGVSPYPSLFIAAEVLDLATARTDGVPFGDDLDGLDTRVPQDPDCNQNCVPDKIDICTGVLTDEDDNCIPDECQDSGSSTCFCTNGAPCGNEDPTGGCINSTGNGARIEGIGTTSVAADNLFLKMRAMPPNQLGIFIMGNRPSAVPFGDGILCVAQNIVRFPVGNSGPNGSITFGPIVSFANSQMPGIIVPGTDRWFQGWFRDPFGPCGSAFNLTHGLSIVFFP